jgi:lysophospholipase L1-like esterase
MFDRKLVFVQELYEPRSEVTYIRDRYGLRGLNYPTSKLELMTVGGSTTDQIYITEGATWQDVIHSRTGIVTANAGVEGMTSRGHIVAVEDWLHRLPDSHPRYFLHYVGVNDAPLPSFPPPWDSWARQLRPRSAIWHAVTKFRDWLADPIVVNHAAVHAWKVSPGEWIKAEVDRSGISEYVERTFKPNLRRLLDIHRRNGETAIFVVQPANPLFVKRELDTVFVAHPDPDIVKWAVALDEINSATGAVCHEQPERCRFIDRAPAILFEPADFYDLIHYTPSGARKIGEFLARELDFVIS